VIADKCFIILTAALLNMWGLGDLAFPNGKYQMTARPKDVAPQDNSIFFYGILNDTWMIAQNISLSQQQTLASLSLPSKVVFFRIRIPLAVPLVQLVAEKIDSCCCQHCSSHQVWRSLCLSPSLTYSRRIATSSLGATICWRYIEPRGPDSLPVKFNCHM
jgi:hypothetical protein